MSTACRHPSARPGLLETCALAVLLACAGASPAPAQPDLVKTTRSRVTLGIPSGWKESTFPGATDLVGMWSPEGKGLFDSTAFVMIGKTDSLDLKLDLKRNTVLSDAEVTVGGQAARRILVQIKGDAGPAGGVTGVAGARAVGVVLKKAGVDGKYLGFVLAARGDQWETYGPLFDKVVSSITIDGVGTTPGGGFMTAVYLDRGVEKPLAGATVLVGRRLTIPPGSPSGIDAVTGDALFLSGTTGDDGGYRPNLPPGTYDVIVWKAGHVPQINQRITVPGGGQKVYVTPDAGVGAFTRHRTLDTGRVFKMDPPNPSRPVVWGRITLGTQRTPTPTPSDPAPGNDVTILVGERLSFVRKEDPRSPGQSVDVVQGDAIYSEVKTNPDGTFAIPMPLGAYSLIVWKQGYIPEERGPIAVWPGEYFTRLLPDDQPGGSGRHQVLDTTSQQIPRKKIDPRPGIRGVVKLSDRGVRTAGEAVTILVGQELRLAHPIIPDPTDQVQGKLLIARAVTNRDGEFFVPVPPGSYHLIAWKAGYVPHEFDPVAVPPGVYNITLGYDNQPGASGRHQKLDTRGVPVPQAPLAVPPLLVYLPLLREAAPPELVPQRAGDVALAVPAGWRKDPDTPADEGAWLTGRADRPAASFAVMRDVSFAGLAELVTTPVREDVKVGGRAATSIAGRLRNEPGVMARLVVVAGAGKDGRQVAFLAKAPEAGWREQAATFDAILASVRLPGSDAAAAPPQPPEDLKEYNRVARIPAFQADLAFVAYEDRATITGAAGPSAALGVAGRGKRVGAAFKAFLEKEPGVAGQLGAPASLEYTALAGAVKVQLFEGGELVWEKASGVVWPNVHAKRPANLRPADEITRYPQVSFGGAYYAVAVYPDGVVIGDPAAKVSMSVKVAAGEHAVPEAFRRVIERNKLEAALGRAASGPEQLFGTAGRVQVYEGGVLVVEPGTERYWWCTHPKRGPTPGGPVLALPSEPNAVVVRLDYVGGYTPPRKTNDPYLVVRAGGRVTLTDPFGKRPTVQSKLTQENVLAFVKFAAAENDFFALDTAGLERGIRAEAKRLRLPTVTDLPTTVITIHTADRTHEVRCYAPEFYAERLPELKAVQQFQAVHQRLAAYMERLRGER
ncbi:MAG: carboxypeptidase regulatory-like domain-containing protein [Gemmataceae bacterium]